MKIRRISAVYWSATGNTEKAVRSLARELSKRLDCGWESCDSTLPGSREKDLYFTVGELAILGMPTYAGRLPNKIAPYLSARIHGGGAVAVPVVTFGNRGYDNALAELYAAAKGDGFHPVAAAALVGRHAFTDALGAGRPGEQDLKEIEQFAGSIYEKVKYLTDIPAELQLPGRPDAPYYVPLGTDGCPANFLKARPATDRSRCDGCGLCARICPMGSIDGENPAEVPGVCIKCQACVRRCPRQAKYFDDPAFLSHRSMLENTFSGPAKNDFFL